MFVGTAALYDSAEDAAYAVREAFSTYDADGSGYIEKGELRSLLLDLGYDASTIEQCFYDADYNQDGYIDYSEFEPLYNNLVAASAYAEIGDGSSYQVR